MEPSPDCESGQIIEVFKKGYMMNKKVIRPTLVKVAQ
jgi:molecular chaperone GrpE (heat shock protein)